MATSTGPVEVAVRMGRRSRPRARGAHRRGRPPPIGRPGGPVWHALAQPRSKSGSGGSVVRNARWVPKGVESWRLRAAEPHSQVACMYFGCGGRVQAGHEVCGGNTDPQPPLRCDRRHGLAGEPAALWVSHRTEVWRHVGHVHLASLTVASWEHQREDGERLGSLVEAAVPPENCRGGRRRRPRRPGPNWPEPSR